MPAVIEFTLQAKPGHYDEVKDKYIAFADAFVQGQPEEEFALITGDVLEAEVIISAMLHHPDSTSTLQAASRWLDSAKRRRDSMPFEVRRG